MIREGLEGKKFGPMEVLYLAATSGRDRRWVCACDCGERHTVSEKSLLAGPRKVCGVKGGAGAFKHGMVGSPEYGTWRHMIDRCENPNNVGWKDYGGRGIKVCARWRASFQAFLADMGMLPHASATIDRLDNNGPYEPGNCHWASKAEQANNARTTRFLTLGGETLPVSAWARRNGLSARTILARIDQLGWSAERALNEPSQRAARRS